MSFFWYQSGIFMCALWWLCGWALVVMVAFFLEGQIEDILESLMTVEEGGRGLAAEFWQWSEEQSKDYAVI